MKRRVVLYLIASILASLGFLVFNWHLDLLPKLTASPSSSSAIYFLNRLIMVLWLAIPGFALELPRLWPYFTGKVNAHTDRLFLLISGLPAFFFAWLPFFVAVLHVPIPDLLMQEPLPAEAIGAFWLGITLGKSIVLDNEH